MLYNNLEVTFMTISNNEKDLDNKTKEKQIEKKLCDICQKTLKDHESNLCYECYSNLYLNKSHNK